VSFVGRTAINGDGTRSFDWEGVQMFVNVAGATYVNVAVNASGGAHGRFVVEAGGVEVTSFYVASYSGSVFLAAAGLSGTTAIRVISVLEPSFTGADATSMFTFIGFYTDGTAAPASPPRARRIELVGDSISAGYGARGSADIAQEFGCPVNENTSGNKYTYNWAIAEHFKADLIPIAWSGKGMYENCCDSGETSCVDAIARVLRLALALARARALTDSPSRPPAPPVRAQCRATTFRRAGARRTRRTGTFRATCPT